MFDYSNGELSAQARDVFEHHLRACANCREYLAQYARVVGLGRRAFAHQDALAAASGVPEELVAAILAARLR
jgi:anti-sigma factor RsiW